MRFNDAILGIVLFLFGGAVMWQAREFPKLPHQNYGSALFPSIIGAGLIICGACLIVTGLKARTVTGKPWVKLGDWSKSPHHIVSMLMIPAGLIVYMLIADTLGFFLTSSLLLFGWMFWLRRHWLSSLVIAIVVTLVINFGFAHYLLVPLPDGIFQPLNWTL